MRRKDRRPTDRCDGCAQKVEVTPSRRCWSCQGEIGRHHKFIIEELEVTYSGLKIRVSALRHRHCDNPLGYHPRKEEIERLKARGVSQNEMRTAWGLR